MKKAKPSRSVRAEIAKLAALPDRDINLEREIPEIHDWSGAVRGRFFRPVKPPAIRFRCHLGADSGSSGPDRHVP
jgi:hypothetical protein